jgi:predicted RNA-binding protein YlqC (UPF0109 family)
MSTTDNDSATEPNFKELVEGIVRSIVDDPSQVQVTETEAEGVVLYEIRVAPGDVGRVIGRKGRVINAIRTITWAAAGRQGKRVNLEVIEPIRKGENDGA